MQVDEIMQAEFIRVVRFRGLVDLGTLTFKAEGEQPMKQERRLIRKVRKTHRVGVHRSQRSSNLGEGGDISRVESSI